LRATITKAIPTLTKDTADEGTANRRVDIVSMER